jgi:hypothetical protein
MLETVLIAAVALLVLAVVVTAILLLRDPEASRRRIEALFRRPAKPAKPPGSDHYYRPYWS